VKKGYPLDKQRDADGEGIVGGGFTCILFSPSTTSCEAHGAALWEHRIHVNKASAFVKLKAEQSKIVKVQIYTTVQKFGIT